MNNTRTLPLVFASFSLLLIACQQSQEVAVETDTSVDVQTEELNTTFDELLKMGRSVQCSFDHTDEAGIHVTGTVYVQQGGENMRGMFDVTDGTDTYDAQMLHVNKTSYVWTSQQPEGIVMHVEDGTLFGDNDAASQTAINDEEQFGFECTPWKVDSTAFKVPQDRQFIDIEAEMDAMMMESMGGMDEKLKGNGTLDMESMYCALCDESPDPSTMAECKKAFDCK